jgi:hypothetical protein
MHTLRLVTSGLSYIYVGVERGGTGVTGTEPQLHRHPNPYLHHPSLAFPIHIWSHPASSGLEVRGYDGWSMKSTVTLKPAFTSTPLAGTTVLVGMVW